MSILTHSVVTLLESETYGCKVSRVIVGSYMTSFDMHGASLTILNLSCVSSDVFNLLDAPTDAPAWLACDISKSDARASASERPEVVVDESSSSVASPAALPPVVDIADFESIAKSLAQKAASALAEKEDLLTKYDTIVGDGDCGITMKRGATEVLERLEKGTISTAHPVPLLASLADAVSASMGGTSGVLLELMFRKMSSTLSRREKIGKAELSNAFLAGVEAIQLYGGATVGSRTMLDALVPASNILVETNDVAKAATVAKEGADGTARMKLASAGRSNYLSAETLEGTPDPGAVAVSIVLGAMQ